MWHWHHRPAGFVKNLFLICEIPSNERQLFLLPFTLALRPAAGSATPSEMLTADQRLLPKYETKQIPTTPSVMNFLFIKSLPLRSLCRDRLRLAAAACVMFFSGGYALTLAARVHRFTPDRPSDGSGGLLEGGGCCVRTPTTACRFHLQPPKTPITRWIIMEWTAFKKNPLWRRND